MRHSNWPVTLRQGEKDAWGVNFLRRTALRLAGRIGILTLLMTSIAPGQTREPKPLKVMSSLLSTGAAAAYVTPKSSCDGKHGLADEFAQSAYPGAVPIDALLSESAMIRHPGGTGMRHRFPGQTLNTNQAG